MNIEIKNALEAKLLAMADDELVLAHRNSEWCGHGPILEEDIAFSNIALDELGHAMVWYDILATLSDRDPDTYPDELVYQRDADAYRNLRLLELPKGDWAFTMLRQYLFDAYEDVHLPHLAESAFAPIADAAAKIRTEEQYHLRHTEAWIRRLGLGTDESNHRTQKALDELWPLTRQIFEPTSNYALLVDANYAPDMSILFAEWRGSVVGILEESNLQIPAGEIREVPDRETHTKHLPTLLDNLQEVYRLAPEARW